MLQDLKKTAMNHAMKIMSHPTFTKIMSDPRVSKALMKGFEIQTQIRQKAEETFKAISGLLGRGSCEKTDTTA
jgi:pyrroloquinoline quinone (PQQ) biosynthesis protein C